MRQGLLKRLRPGPQVFVTLFVTEYYKDILTHINIITKNQRVIQSLARGQRPADFENDFQYQFHNVTFFVTLLHSL